MIFDFFIPSRLESSGDILSDKSEEYILTPHCVVGNASRDISFFAESQGCCHFDMFQ